jgi:cytochrome c oxidase subunit 3
MWLFLATELLMFGGLFVAYAVYRGNHAEIFSWGSALLDRKLGTINTIVLISSSFTMAFAVSAAQRGWRWRQVVLLGLTFLGACGFLAIKYMEYRPKIEHGLLWGQRFDPDPVYVAAHYGGGHHAVAATGQDRTEHDTAAGHGESGESTTTGQPETEAITIAGPGDAESEAPSTAGPQPGDGPPVEPEVGLAEEGEGSWLPASVIPTAMAAPVGLDPALLGSPEEEHDSPMPPPPGADRFFAVYFMMTGLHGIHVIAGMLVIGWLMVGAALGRYGAAYYTPVDLGGLFWHLVDLIWIFLFPLFYLI